MRTLSALALAALLSGCATAHVTLLDGEPGMGVGSVAVQDQKTGVDRGVLDAADTRAAIGGHRVRARPVDPARYGALTAAMPPPPSHFTLYFVEGGTDLIPDSQPELQRMLAEVAKRPGVEVQITGHTDTLGTTEDNDVLSIARAVQVRDALSAMGLNPGVTRTVGRGERELLVPTEDGVREDRNRRVEITVR
jgi:outer membrane protein OmpA-like peptidoglycan-associated protein